MAYRSPAPGATVGRTDEGVDYATRPGSSVRAIGAGIIEFVGRYTGFGSYVVERLTEGPAAGQRVYYAEQARPSVRPRQRVAAGQRVGVASGSLEVGFAQGGPTYLPAAQAEGGYTEGQVTAAGRRFRSLLFGGRAQPPAGPGQTLEALWIDAGGKPGLARLMAAIALAESGGVSKKSPPNLDGSVDYGIWQINSSHSQYDPGRLLSDPLYNARAAVAVERSQGLAAWTTYTSGAYRRFLARAPGARAGALTAPITRPGGGNDSGASAQDAAWYSWLTPDPPPGGWSDPFGAFGIFKGASDAVNSTTDFLKWVAWLFHPRNILRAVEFLAGAGLLGLGIWTSVESFRSSSSSGSGRSRTRVVTRIARSSPPGRALAVRQAASQGRKQARAGRRSAETLEARTKARRREETRLGNRRANRAARKGPRDEIPF